SPNDQHTYINISAKSAPLFAVGQRDPQQPSGPEPEETLEQLIEKKNRWEARNKNLSEEILKPTIS
ncbi:11799_t:CDS:2, partial [Gigaspora rosea]